MLSNIGIYEDTRIAVFIENQAMQSVLNAPESTPLHVDLAVFKQYLVQHTNLVRISYFFPLDRNPEEADSQHVINSRSRIKWMSYNGYECHVREYDSRHIQTANFEAAIATEMMYSAYNQNLEAILLIAHGSGLAYAAKRCLDKGVRVIGLLNSNANNHHSFLRSSLSETLDLEKFLNTANVLSDRRVTEPKDTDKPDWLTRNLSKQDA